MIDTVVREVVDFGLASNQKDMWVVQSPKPGLLSTETRSGIVLGTRRIFHRNRQRGAGDARSDLFALARS